MKKIISLISVFMFLFSFSAAITSDDAGNALVKMGLMSGYPDGSLGLENNITRAEFCTLVAKMLKINEEINFEVDNFSDLNENHWAYNSVMALADRGVINGYTDSTFRPSKTLTYAECSAILIGVLGYKSEMLGVWPDNVMDMAENLALNKDLTIEKHSDNMTRGNVSIMLMNAMNVVVKN